MMPTFLGRPFYPGAAPIPKENIKVNGRSIQQIFLDHCNGVASKEDEETLKEYVIYYISAPLFDTAELLSKNLASLPLDDLIMECLNYGIDPL